MVTISDHQILLTQKYHCSQTAVLGPQLQCPYIENVSILSVLTLRGYCTSDEMTDSIAQAAAAAVSANCNANQCHILLPICRAC